MCFSAQPQEHAGDNASLVETPDALETARSVSGSRPIAVTPLTLRERINSYATGPAPDDPPGGLPPRVDVRQTALLGAGWTLGSLKHLAEGGAASTTWFETVGPLGVIQSEAGPPWPDSFRLRPGMSFPLYHVLADANEWPGARVVEARSNQPLRVEALAFRRGDATRILPANLTDEPVVVTVSGAGATARVRLLDEASFARATEEPEAFRSEAGEARATPGGRLDLALRPFAYARIDTARGAP